MIFQFIIGFDDKFSPKKQRIRMSKENAFTIFCINFNLRTKLADSTKQMAYTSQDRYKNNALLSFQNFGIRLNKPLTYSFDQYSV
jgi:hypothetical protein